MGMDPPHSTQSMTEMVKTLCIRQQTALQAVMDTFDRVHGTCEEQQQA